MADTGVKYPGSVAQVSNATETIAWATTDLTAVGGSIAEVTSNSFDADVVSQILECTNFSLGITAKTIDGVVLEIYRQCDVGATRCVDYRVQLMNGTGSYIGTNKAATTTNWPATYATATYGGVSDGWSAGLSQAIVNGTGFGVAISAQSKYANSECQIDYIRITVYYTAAQNYTWDVPLVTLGEKLSVTKTIRIQRTSSPKEGLFSDFNGVSLIKRTFTVKAGLLSLKNKALEKFTAVLLGLKTSNSFEYVAGFVQYVESFTALLGLLSAIKPGVAFVKLLAGLKILQGKVVHYARTPRK